MLTGCQWELQWSRSIGKDCSELTWAWLLCRYPLRQLFHPPGIVITKKQSCWCSNSLCQLNSNPDLPLPLELTYLSSAERTIGSQGLQRCLTIIKQQSCQSTEPWSRSTRTWSFRRTFWCNFISALPYGYLRQWLYPKRIGRFWSRTESCGWICPCFEARQIPPYQV